MVTGTVERFEAWRTRFLRYPLAGRVLPGVFMIVGSTSGGPGDCITARRSGISRLAGGGHDASRVAFGDL